MQDKNFLLAIVLSAGVLFIWTMLFAPEPVDPALEAEIAAIEAAQNEVVQSTGPTSAGPTLGSTTPDAPTSTLSAPAGAAEGLERGQALLIASSRVRFESAGIEGSINLDGARIDDLKLMRYRETTDKNSPEIVLLSPSSAVKGYFAHLGWINATGGTTKLPSDTTTWTQAYPGTLTPSSPLELYWDNQEGLIFRQTISIDDNYMFTITQAVENNTQVPVVLHPYGLTQRKGEPETEGFYILHEGFLGIFADQLEEKKYDKINDDGTFRQSSTGGWLGITDKYWLTALIPPQNEEFHGSFSGAQSSQATGYQADYLLSARTIAPGGRDEVTHNLFSGAKEDALLRAYEKNLNIQKFDFAIDWGIWQIITKPMFLALDYFGKALGNFGISILIVTVLLKLLFFPLANKQYASMAKMKKIQPEMTALRERYGDDKVKQQQEMMELYKREKINPLAGCFPILIQIPVFFALYKVLFVTIEMRQAPFFGWIQDLSVPDPTSVFNLFGLIPWDPSAVPLIGSFLALGFWPLLMGTTMFLQMQMNPPPPDPVQAKVFQFMPLFFMFLLASFPAGLVIYWAWNNSLSMLQQYVIMRRMGTKVELAKNLGFDKLIARFTGGASAQLQTENPVASPTATSGTTEEKGDGTPS